RPRCERQWETAPTPSPMLLRSSQLSLREPTSPAPERHARALSHRHGLGSRLHRPATGSRPDHRPTASRVATEARRTSRPAEPNYRRRSPAIFSVAIEIGQQLLQRQSGDRLTRRQRLKRPLRWGKPAFANPAFYKGLVLVPPRRHDLGDDTAAVGDHDGLTFRGQPDVFAQLVLQNLQPDGVHHLRVASRSYFVQSLAGVRCGFLLC